MSDNPLRVAALISGGGTTLVKVLEHQLSFVEVGLPPPYEVVVIFSDSNESNAEEIHELFKPYFDIPVVIDDYDAFRKDNSGSRNSLRSLYDKMIVDKLGLYNPDVLAYLGWSRIASPVLVNWRLGVNTHPGDLSILVDGKPKYGGRGMLGLRAVQAQIDGGERYLRATSHLVTEDVDAGPILMRSAPLPIMGDDPHENLERLRVHGDWKIAPLTLEFLATGRLEYRDGGVFFDGQHVPEGAAYENL